MGWVGLLLFVFVVGLWYLARCSHDLAVRETRVDKDGVRRTYLVCYECRRKYELNPKGKLLR